MDQSAIASFDSLRIPYQLAPTVMQVRPKGSEEFHPWILRIIVYSFKIAGLAPFSLLRHAEMSLPTRNPCTTYVRALVFSKMGKLYNFVVLIMVLIMFALEMPYLYSNSLPNQSSLTEIMDTLYYILSTAISCFVIIYWVIGQNRAIVIINRLLSVHHLLSGLKNQVSKKKPFVLLAVHMLFNAVLWTTFYTSTSIVVGSFFRTFSYYTPLFLIYWFIVEYSIVLNVLAREYESLNECLLNLNEFSVDLFCTPLPNNHLRTVNLRTHKQLAILKLLYNIRTTLFEVSRDVEEFFSFPILLAVACFSFSLVYSSYYFMTSIIIPLNDVLLSFRIYTVASMFAILYPLILLPYNVTEASKKAAETGLLVHKLLATAKEQHIIAELEHFSLQLIHEDVNFKAYGFFNLDFTLLQSILGATITYLVIIIQFMSSADT